METAACNGLADRLRRDTRALHAEAEGSGLMAALIAGTIDRATYGALLVNLHALYVALERALSEHRDSPLLDFARVPPLPRAAALAGDLELWFAPPGGTRPVPVAATQAYVQRLADLSAREPIRLVAHAYVRYLGDVHGGQQLARAVRERFQLAGPEGTRFYDFGPPDTVRALRLGIRAQLDALPVTPAEVDAIADEACSAFRRHIELFGQLDVSR